MSKLKEALEWIKEHSTDPVARETAEAALDDPIARGEVPLLDV